MLDPSTTVYLRADFTDVILVQGMALQGTSPTAHYATKQFAINYQFNGSTVHYNDNEVIILFNKINKNVANVIESDMIVIILNHFSMTSFFSQYLFFTCNVSSILKNCQRQYSI